MTVESGSDSTKPKVLFVGNSFMWGIANQVPLHDVFSDVEFWYYFSTAYTGDSLTPIGNVVDFNLLERFLDFDYIVWFTTGNQLNKGTMGFAKSAILTLAVDDSLRTATIRHIADTCNVLKNTDNPGDVARNGSTDTLMHREARTMLYNHPEWIPALVGDSLTTRNEEIPYAKYTKDIRKDSVWMAALEAQAFVRTATMRHILHAEVDRLKAGRPLYKDQADEIRFARQCMDEVKPLMEKMRGNEKSMQIVREKAEKHGKTFEKALEDDAIWLIREKYHLDRCRLADDPDAEIPIPPGFQSK